MSRFVLALCLMATLFSCGTPCSRVAAAEANADERGKGCNSSRNAWASSRVTTCENNLANCTQNDFKQFELYANCLNALPTCNEGQRTSWELQRAACSIDNILFKITASCAGGL
jgi:hypothetical protein